MLKRILLVLLALLIVAVVVADRVGAHVAAHVLAGKVQDDEHLPSRPDASIGGFPFLTQAINGKYSDVSITAHHLVVDGVPVNTLVAHLHGVHVSASRALDGDVTRVPVDRTDGQVTLTYADMNHYLASKHLRVSDAGNDRVKVVGVVTVAGHQVSAGGIGTVSVSGNVVRFAVSRVTVAAGSSSGSVPTPITVSVPLLGLPFRISLASVRATSSGVVGVGTVHHLVLGG